MATAFYNLKVRTAGEPGRKLQLPAWLLSVVLHAGLVVVLGLSVTVGMPGPVGDDGRTVGIVVARPGGQPDVFEFDSADSAADPAPPVEEAVPDNPPIDLSDTLPQAQPLIGPALPRPGDARDMLAAPGGGAPASGAGLPGQTEVEFFGAEATGHSFVFVLDRSESMRVRNALGVARAHLIAALEALGPRNQFDVIFYNQEPSRMVLGDGRLQWADETNLALARQFIGRIQPAGATNHLEALKAALRLDADVIFFLTDADVPVLYPDDLAEIARRNAGRAQIHCIEFGRGPQPAGDNFLTQLARDNGGRHTYVNINDFPR